MMLLENKKYISKHFAGESYTCDKEDKECEV